MTNQATKVPCQNKACTRGPEGAQMWFTPYPGKPNKYCCIPCRGEAKRGVSIKAEAPDTYHKIFGHRTHKEYAFICANPACKKPFKADKPHRTYCSIPCCAAGRSLKLKGRYIPRTKPRKSFLTRVA